MYQIIQLPPSVIARTPNICKSYRFFCEYHSSSLLLTYRYRRRQFTPAIIAANKTLIFSLYCLCEQQSRISLPKFTLINLQEAE